MDQACTSASASVAHEAQFEQLYRDERTKVYNLAARVVGNPEDAADIVQDVFTRAYVRPPRRGDDGSLDAWLHRVTVNACYDCLRRRGTRAAAPLDDTELLDPAEDGFATAETRRAIREALASMNVRYRTALVLRDLHGLDVREIAAAMSVSSATARVLLHRSRRAFRRSFQELAPTAGGLSALSLAALLPELPLPASLAAVPAPAVLAPPAVGILAQLGGVYGAKAVAVTAAAVVLAAGGGLALREGANPASSAPVPVASSPISTNEPGTWATVTEGDRADWLRQRAGEESGSGEPQPTGEGSAQQVRVASREGSSRTSPAASGAGADAAGSSSGKQAAGSERRRMTPAGSGEASGGNTGAGDSPP
jgi:RNA polymerase sigma-70 factor (ECF subfamily)